MSIQVSARVTGWGANGSSVTISELLKLEAEALECSTKGLQWFRFENGRLISHPVTNPLPALVDDRLMTPHFAGDRQTDHLGNPDITRVRNVKDLTVERGSKHYDPSFIIQHIDAGVAQGRSDATYLKAAAALESWGFEMLRSRRGRNGQFWELWFLPGLWCAEGDLAAAIKPFSDFERREARLRAAIDFLAKSGVPFATLDVCVQRLAITFD